MKCVIIFVPSRGATLFTSIVAFVHLYVKNARREESSTVPAPRASFIYVASRDDRL